MQVDISEIIIPEDVVIHVSAKRIETISKAFGTESEILFFVIAVKGDNGKYSLVDRYDVYMAAKKCNSKKIRTLVVSDYDDNIKAQLILSQKHFPNPATVIRIIEPFVQQHGLKKTLQMFYLDSYFEKMHAAGLDATVLGSIESVINHAHGLGVRSVIPVQLFEELVRHGSVQNQQNILERMQSFIDVQRSKFRWPHKEFFLMLTEELPQKASSQKKEKKAEAAARFFDCTKCGASHTVTPGHIGPTKEVDGVILIDGDDAAEPAYTLPQKYRKHLGVKEGDVPTILLSDDMDWSTMKKRLKNKNFVVFVGSNTS